MAYRLFRDDLSSIPAYVPGRTIPGAIKMASNEVTESPSQVVLDAVTAAAASGNRYPDTSSADLRAAIANALNQDLQAHNMSTTSHITPEQIVVGNGSVSLIQHLIQATCCPDWNVVMPWRSFEAYPIMGRIAHAKVVQVPNLPDGKHDMHVLASAGRHPAAGLVLLCNPNNPTGETFSHDELVDFLNTVPRTIVAVDEAYYHYNRLGTFPRTLELLSDYPNLVVLRTFSKAYGLAGLRVGYLVGSEEVCSELNKVVTPFATSAVAQQAAIAALTVRDELLARTDAVVEERQRVTQELRNMGFTVCNSEANFVWLPRTDAQELTDYLTEQKVLVRGFAGDGVRVTISTREENTAFLDAIAGYPAI